MVTTGSLLTYGSARARWTLAATVGGSAIASIDATAVSIALPATGREFGAASRSCSEWSPPTH